MAESHPPANSPCAPVSGSGLLPSVLSGYTTDGFFDEMFTPEGMLRPHYRKFVSRFGPIPRDELDAKRSAVDALFLRQGITFNVYGDSQGTERIFPFDLLPRIIPSAEWEKLEAGLVQRITALNLFTRVRRHITFHQETMERLPSETEFKKLHFFKTVIPENVTLSEAPMSAKPIAVYDASATGAEAFRELANEVAARLEK